MAHPCSILGIFEPGYDKMTMHHKSDPLVDVYKSMGCRCVPIFAGFAHFEFCLLFLQVAAKLGTLAHLVASLVASLPTEEVSLLFLAEAHCSCHQLASSTSCCVYRPAAACICHEKASARLLSSQILHLLATGHERASGLLPNRCWYAVQLQGRQTCACSVTDIVGCGAGNTGSGTASSSGGNAGTTGSSSSGTGSAGTSSGGSASGQYIAYQQQ